jgi:hypothetical protein
VKRKVVYFETSAINWLTEHDDVLVELLASRAVRAAISGWGVAEIVETRSAATRRRLLDTCRRIAKKGLVFGWHIEVHQQAIRAFTDSVTWREMWFGRSSDATIAHLRSPESIDEVHWQAARSGNRALTRKWEKGIARMQAYADKVATVNSEEAWVPLLFDNETRLQSVLHRHRVCVASLAAAAHAVRGPKRMARPLRAAILSEWIAVYNRCVHRPARSKRTGQGRDLLHGIYLAACDVFVTGDRRHGGQATLMSAVARHLHHSPEVLSVEGVQRLLRMT